MRGALRLASSCLAGDAGLRHAGDHLLSGEPIDTPKNTAANSTEAEPDLVGWSTQEIRRIATRLAQRRIQPVYIIAWSHWRRAHQTAARRSHLKRKMQL